MDIWFFALLQRWRFEGPRQLLFIMLSIVHQPTTSNKSCFARTMTSEAPAKEKNSLEKRGGGIRIPSIRFHCPTEMDGTLWLSSDNCVPFSFCFKHCIKWEMDVAERKKQISQSALHDYDIMENFFLPTRFWGSSTFAFFKWWMTHK